MEKNPLEPNNQKPTDQDATQGKIHSKELDAWSLHLIEMLKEPACEYLNGFYRSSNLASVSKQLWEKGESEISPKIVRYDILENIESFIDLAQTIIDSYNKKRFEIYYDRKILLGVSDLMREIDDQTPHKLYVFKDLYEADLFKFYDLYKNKVRNYLEKNSSSEVDITQENFGTEKTLELAELIINGIKDIKVEESSVEAFLKVCDVLNIEYGEGIKNKIKGTLLTYKERPYREKMVLIHEQEIDNLLNGNFTDFKSFYSEAKKVYELLKKSCDNDEENCSGWCRQITCNIGRYLNDKNVLQLVD